MQRSPIWGWVRKEFNTTNRFWKPVKACGKNYVDEQQKKLHAEKVDSQEKIMDFLSSI